HLSEEDQNRAEDELAEQANPWGFPTRMEGAKDRWEMAINPGNEGQTGAGSDESPGGSEVADHDEKSHDGDNGFPVNFVRGNEDRLHQALQIANFGRRQGYQNADGPNNVAEGDSDPGNEQRPRDRATRVLDFISHEGSGFASVEGVDQRAPENHVLQVSAGNQGVHVKACRGAEAVEGHGPHGDDNERGDPHGEGAKVMEPGTDVKTENVQPCGEGERD